MHTFMQAHLRQKFNHSQLNITIVLSMSLIFFLGIRSLQTNKHLFEQLLLEENVNSFILNETYLKHQHTCKIPRYHMLRQDSQIPARQANGGVAFGLSPHTAYRQHNSNILNLPEHSIATLYYKHVCTTIAAIYVRPGHIIPNNFFMNIDNNYRNYLIMADINIHSRSDREKKRLSQCCHTTNIRNNS